MEDRTDEVPIKIILVGILIYAAYELVNKVIAAITALLMGFVYIALGIAGILALFWLYRYITDKQYGETKKLQQIEKLERQRKLHTSKLPKHMREVANQYYFEKQNALYDLKPSSRVDAMLDRTKQVFSTFRKKEK